MLKCVFCEKDEESKVEYLFVFIFLLSSKKDKNRVIVFCHLKSALPFPL